MLFKCAFFYTSKTVAQLRKNYNLKVCFKKHLNFLKYKENPSKSLSNRLVKNSNYARSFKDLHYFYVLYLRSNLSNANCSDKFNCYFKTSNNYYFLNNYKQYLALNDLNRALLWRLLQVNSIFKLYTSVKKKKKKNIYTNRLQFIFKKIKILIA